MTTRTTQGHIDGWIGRRMLQVARASLKEVGMFKSTRRTLILLVALTLSLTRAVQPPAARAAGSPTVVGWGNNGSGQTSAPADLSDVTSIAGGNIHSLVLKSDGTVVGWGWNDDGQTSVPADLSDVTSIAGGNIHSLALKSDGTVVGWGDNDDGQTSVPADLSDVTAIAAGLYHSLALKRDGTVVDWGANGHGQRNVPVGLIDVTAIAAGGYHSLAIAIDTTPPAISPSIAGPSKSGWYTGDVTVSWSVSDPESPISARSGCDTTTITTDTTGTTLTCSATSVGGTSTQSVTIKRDATAPSITCGAADGLWHNADVSIACTATDGGAGPATQSVSLSTSVAANTEAANAATDSQSICDAAGNCATAGPISGNQVDKQAPALQSCDAPDGQWHANNVTLDCTYSDGGSGPADQTVGLSTDVAAGSEDANATASTSSQACDAVGNCAATPAAISGNKIDRQAPSITITSPTNTTYLLNQAVAAGYSCADGGAGIATCDGPVASGSRIDTTSAGAKTFAVQASDNAGNTASQSASYAVGYAFSGFLAPVNAAPTVNTGKAGKTYPVKWQLSDANGASISRLDAVQAITYQRTSCAAFSSDPTETLETSTTGGTSLRYDSTTNQYVYNWATPATRGCYTLFLTLDSGQVFPAYFNLN